MEKFYNKDWFMWLMFAVCAPIGIFLMWKNKRYHIISRIIVSILYLLLFLLEYCQIGSEYSGLSVILRYLGEIIFFAIIPYILVHLGSIYDKLSNIYGKYQLSTNKMARMPKPIVKIYRRIYKYFQSLHVKREIEIKKVQETENKKQEAFNFYRQGRYLPIIQCSIILHKEELCHLVCNAERYEVKERTMGYSSGYGGVSFRVAKGVSLHTGRSRGRSIKGNVSYKYSGNLYITNKRIIFTGSNKNFSIDVSKLLEYKLYKDGVMFNTNRMSYTVLVENIEYVGAILQGIINNFSRSQYAL